MYFEIQKRIEINDLVKAKFCLLLLFSYQEIILNGSNTDGSFTMAVSNSFMSPLEQIP